jgi:hypothetical protein
MKTLHEQGLPVDSMLESLPTDTKAPARASSGTVRPI